MILVYDGSFEGFLTIVYDVYYKKIEVEKIKRQMPQSLFVDDIIEIETDNEKAKKVLEALKNKFPKNYFEDILVVFMCDSLEFELDLLHYIIYGFKSIKNLENITLKAVFNVKAYLQEYFRHNHKLTGFLRFIELDDGTLYAKLDSKFNNVYHLGIHFTKRFNNQKYIIHDRQRKVAYIYNENFQGVQEVSSFEEPNISNEEVKFSKLWKKFFESVSIKERENLKLQKQWIPLLYRTYMTEFIP